MSDHPKEKNNFLDQLIEQVEKNLSDENFGVSELASAIGMSRSNLLRKIKHLTNLSASQFIREERLKHAMEMLQTESYNVSEVSYKVGFSSTSYFIKCFREFYGYPPGEVGKRTELVLEDDPVTKKERNVFLRMGVMIGISLVFLVAFYLVNQNQNSEDELEKSIAVLPFKNDSNDSTNLYLINGLMESTLNSLQKIENLRVVSRTSAERYRNQIKSIPEIAKELGVNYLIEGSGQKIGDDIFLNIQLIRAHDDKHLWAEQYRRKGADIFELQQEVALKIAKSIEAIVTPEETDRLVKIPTHNLVAYDYFLKGLEKIREGKNQRVDQSIEYFELAIKHDADFALAYALGATAYYYMDIFQAEKRYTGKINEYSERAMQLDPELSEALIARAYYYEHLSDHKASLPYLEKALKFNPNSSQAIMALSNYYANIDPDTEKYLEYALKGAQLNVAAKDSIQASYVYLHMANALIQVGFVDEALVYIDKCLSYNPNNPFGYVKAFIRYAKNKDLNEIRGELITELQKDTTRVDILQEVGKMNYYLRDYDSAAYYYDMFLRVRENMGYDLYRHQHGFIGRVFLHVGEKEKANALIEDYLEYTGTDHSLYHEAILFEKSLLLGDTATAIDHLTKFTEEDNYHYWTVLFFELDPDMDALKKLPGFQDAMTRIKDKFWKNHERIKKRLTEENLI